MIRFVALPGIAALAFLSACAGQGPLQNTFDGEVFRPKFSTSRANDLEFTIQIPGVSKSELGAREAGRFEATEYCLRYYGTSLIDWDLGPDDADAQIEGDVLILRGACAE